MNPARMERVSQAAQGDALASTGASAEFTHDLLLFSDVHLGSDLKRRELRRAGSFDALISDSRIDGELIALLDHYAAHTGPAGRWRLILAGDVVDFLGVNLTPRDLGERVTFEQTSEEDLYGLEPGPERCAWMMSLVVRRHERFFRRLAAFLADGHELVVIRGNHDAAFFWPQVQQAFADALVRFAHESHGAVVADPIRSRVQFEEWFYLEPGRIYVEHGHLHDEYCAEPDVRLVNARRPDRLNESVSAVLLRYFANRFPSLDLDDIDNWSAWQFVRWAFVTENPLQIFAAFVRTVAILLLPPLRRALRRRRRGKGTETVHDVDEVTGEHEIVSRVRSRLTQGVAQAEALALGLARLVRRTAQVGVHGVLRLFFLDRMAAVGGTAALSATCVSLDAPWEVKGALAVGLLALGVVVERRLATMRGVAIGPKLRRAAEEIAPLAQVPLIVMGHSHKALDTPVAGGRARYVNLGSWLGATRTTGPRLGYPHLVVRGTEASFLRWHAPVVETDPVQRAAA